MALNNAWNIGWYNQNSYRAYPITEDISQLDTSSTFTLPNDFLVDLSWTFVGNLDASLFHILSLSVTDNSIIVVLGYDNLPAGKAVIDKSTFTRNSSYLIAGTGDYYDCVGTLVVNSLDSVLNALVTEVIFDAANARLEASTTRGLIRGIATLNAYDDNDELTGDILLDVGTNVRVDHYIVGDVVYLTLNAISNNNFIADCLECGDVIVTDRQLFSINGIPADVNGNISIIGDPCMDIVPLEHGLQFNDLCSQPCCGCQELEVVKEDFRLLKEEVESINTVSQSLAGELSALSLNLLSSQTDDIPTNVDTMVNLMQALLNEALSNTDCNPPC